MRQRRFFSWGARNAALAALLLSALAVPSLEAQPCTGTRIFGNGTPVRVVIRESSADFTSDIELDVGLVARPVLATNHDVGKIVRDIKSIRGAFGSTDELKFSIFVRETGDRFSIGPADRNPDGKCHAVVTPIGRTGTAFRVRFEDTFEGGDEDYDDVIFDVYQGVPFGGLDHNPLGDTALTPAGGGLVISPILVSGDGFDVRLGDTTGWERRMEPLKLPAGSELVFTARNPAGEAEVVERHSFVDADTLSMRLDFSRTTPQTTLSVSALLRGNVVKTVTLSPSGATVGLSFPPILYRAAPKDQPKPTPPPQPTPPPKGHIWCIFCSISITRPAVVSRWEEPVFMELGPGSGEVEADEIAVHLEGASGPAFELSNVEVTGKNLPSFTLTGEEIAVFNNFHGALGSTIFDAVDGSLGLLGLGTGGADGVSINLESAASFQASWLPLLPVGLTNEGSFLDFDARGTLGGVPGSELGRVRFTQVAGKVQALADLSGVSSPSQRIEVWDQGQRVALVTGHTGVAARATAWPIGGGKIGLPPTGSTSCITVDFPDGTWIDVPGGPKVLGDKLFILSENPSAPVESVSNFTVTASSIPALTLTSETVAPLAVPAPNSSCVPGPTRLCLNQGRFAVEAEWRDPAGQTAHAQAVPMTRDTGYFWFFDPGNIETAVKVIDGRERNGKWWVFHGGLSTLEYRITVTDTATGAQKVYRNEARHMSSGGDTTAFDAGPETAALAVDDFAAPAFEPATTAGSCADPNSLCLQDGRFEIAVEWRDFEGHTGRAQGVPMADASGYLWFFDPAHADVFVKVLDGRPANGHWWLFYGSLSNVELKIIVKDTVTGKVKTYFNPMRRFTSGADTRM